MSVSQAISYPHVSASKIDILLRRKICLICFVLAMTHSDYSEPQVIEEEWQVISCHEAAPEAWDAIARLRADPSPDTRQCS